MFSISKTLILCIFTLFAASVAVAVGVNVFGMNHIYGLGPLFMLDQERNIPTWFATQQLCLAAVFLAFIARHYRQTQENQALYWVGLSLLFFYLSIDENISIHEAWMNPMRAIVGAEGFFYFAWVVPAIPVVLVLAAIYAPFFWKLERSVKRYMLIGLILFVAGGLGMEMVGGYYRSGITERNLVYDLITNVEELLELLGVAFFIQSLLIQMQSLAIFPFSKNNVR